MPETDTTISEMPPTVGPAVRLLYQLRDRGEPVRLTINGTEEVLVEGEAILDELIGLVDRIDTVAVLRDRIRRLRDGEKGYSRDEIKQELHRRHGSTV